MKYRQFAVALKAFRIAANESIDELSNAVEITREELLNYESGRLRPSAQNLVLISSHFLLRRNEAKRLFQLAGYGNLPNLLAEAYNGELVNDEFNVEGPLADIIHVVSNEEGIIIHFLKNPEDGIEEPNIISRIGMTKNQARSMLRLLLKSLEEKTDETRGDFNP